jgi:putative MATE family efflux protein
MLKVLKLAWPIILQNLMLVMMNVVDTFMLGRFSVSAIASIGIASPILWTVILLLTSLSTGTIATVSRAVGEKNISKQVEDVSASITCALVIGALCAIIGLLFLPYLVSFYFIPENPKITSDAELYLLTVVSIAPFIVVESICASIMRSFGDTKTPMIIGGLENGINIIANYLLIFGKLGAPQLGVWGAGIATALSATLGSTTLFILLIRREPIKSHSKIIKNVTISSIKRLLKISTPAAIQPLIVQVGFLIYVKVVTSLGELPFAAHRTAIIIEQLSFITLQGLSVACSIIVGQSLGARDIKSAEEGFNSAIKLGLRFSLALAILFLAIPGFLMEIFVPNVQNVINLGALCLMISSIEQPFMWSAGIVEGTLKGAGDTKSPLFVAIVGVWLIRLPLSYLFAITFRMALPGIWIVMIIDWAIRFTLYWVIYKRGKWKSIKL